MRPEEWIVSDDTGTSSKTIWCVMMGVENKSKLGNGTPSDPSDFGRCYRLLENLPQWKPRLNEVAKKFPRWKKMVKNWDTLTELYVRDEPTGKSTEMYNLMQELNK